MKELNRCLSLRASSMMNCIFDSSFLDDTQELMSGILLEVNGRPVIIMRSAELSSGCILQYACSKLLQAGPDRL